MHKKLSLLLTSLLGAALLPASSPQPEPIFRVAVDTVPVYVSVKDGKGRPIRGLTPADFQVLEDGLEQQIVNFQEVELDGRIGAPSGSETAGAPETVGSAPTSAAGERRYIVMRFDPLMSPRSLQRAQDAAREVVGQLQPKTDFAAVSWRNAMSEFTQDRERLQRLIGEIRPDLLALSLALDRPADPARQSFSATGGAGLTDDLEQIFPQVPNLELLTNVLDEVVTLGTREPFAPAISALKYLQGRKICFYFGLGLGVPRVDDPDKSRYDPRRNARLFSDAGFTVFAVNPGGGGVELGQGVRAPATGPTSGGRRSMRARSESTFVMPNASGLGNIYLRRWAEETGGFAVYNNNNLKKIVERVFDFSEHYYLLAYRAGLQDYDAKFRRIDVKLRSGKGKVAHRSGYFATAPTSTDLLQRTIATAMMSPEAFRDFPLEVTTRRTAADVLEVEFAFPFSTIELLEQQVQTGRNKREKRHLQEIYLTALVRDARGRPVGSLQQRFDLELEEEQLDELRSQNATVTRTLHLSGEPVSMEGVVVVGQNQQISAIRRAVQGN